MAHSDLILKVMGVRLHQTSSVGSILWLLLLLIEMKSLSWGKGNTSRIHGVLSVLLGGVIRQAHTQLDEQRKVIYNNT